MSEFVVVSGLSGAGRSTVADVLEDLGWFVIDNLPPSLINKVAELVQRPGADTSKVALVIGRGGYGDDLHFGLDELRDGGSSVRVVFLEASDDVLIRRYEGSRRRHPMEEQSISDAIASERELLVPVKETADVVIDTTDLNVHQLRARVLELFEGNDPTQSMRTSIVTFGYKHGLPLDVDLVFDCRFLPNPHWIPELRPQTGQNSAVRDYVLNQPEAKEFVEKLDDMLQLLLPAFVKEGKAYTTIAIGCTGGRHRSVAIAEEIAKRIADQGYAPVITHRDIAK